MVAIKGSDLNVIGFVEAFHVGPKQKPTSILIKPSFTTGRKGAAFGIASAWFNPYNKQDSCNYIVDAAQVLNCVPDRQSSYPYGAGAYVNTITINMCYDPPEGPPRYEVVCNTAKLVAMLCKKHKIRLRILSEEEINRWGKRKWRSRGGIDILDCIGLNPDQFYDLTRAMYNNL